MKTVEELKKLKASLEEKRASVAAEKKFLEAEKKRLQDKLQALGFKNLAELKTAKEELERTIVSLEENLSKELDRLNNANLQTLTDTSVSSAEQVDVSGVQTVSEFTDIMTPVTQTAEQKISSLLDEL